MSKCIKPLTCCYSFGNPAALRTVSNQGKSRLRSLAASVELDHGLASGSRLNERLIGDCGRGLPP